MSLDFGGWQVTVGKNEKVSAYTEEADMKVALKEAMDLYMETNEFKNRTNKMYGKSTITFEYLMITKMPT